MQISGYGAVSQGTWPAEQKRRTTSGMKEVTLGVSDSVHFSEEALNRLREMQRAKNEAAARQGEEAYKKRQAEWSIQECIDNGVVQIANQKDLEKWAIGNSQSSGFGDTASDHTNQKVEASSMHTQNRAAAESSSSSDTIEAIEKQIERLKGKIKELGASMNKMLSKDSMPIETREQMAKPAEDQISQLYAQIAELESQKAEILEQQTKQG